MTAPLTPPRLETRGMRRGRFGFAFTPRFFIAIASGAIWLIAVAWSSRWVPILVLWNLLIIAGWLWDLLRLPAADQWTVARAFSGPLMLGRRVKMTLEVQHAGKRRLRVSIIDELSPKLSADAPQFTLDCAVGEAAQYDYEIVPLRRGDTNLGSIFFRYQTTFGLAERWAVAPLTDSVCVIPDVAEANQQALYLIRSRQVDVQIRRHRDPGLGREFDALREYRQGDELREVCWPATARRHALVTRTFRAERSQTVWAIIDAGRLMRAEIATPDADFRRSKLDYSVNAALSIAKVAIQYGDRVATFAYGRSIQQAVSPGTGPAQIRSWVEALARVRAETVEANHALAARVLLQKQTRRALVVWITDFAETPTTPDVVEYAAHIAKKHLVLFVAVSQADLAIAARQVPRTEPEMYRAAAALSLLQRREVLLRSLRQSGVLALEVPPGRLTTALLNEYLMIKDRNLL